MSTPQFIGALLDNLITIFGTVFLFYFYTQKKKKIYIIAGSLLVLVGLFQIYEDLDKFKSSKISSKESLIEKINEQTPTTKDTNYYSKKGYFLIIPEGYRFTETQSDLSLLAKHESNSSNISVILTGNTTDQLATIINESNEYLKKNNSYYKSKPPNYFKSTGIDGANVEFEIDKPAGRFKGYAIYYKSNNNVYTLMVSCLKDRFETESIEFEKVISSFKINNKTNNI